MFYNDFCSCLGFYGNLDEKLGGIRQDVRNIRCPKCGPLKKHYVQQLDGIREYRLLKIGEKKNRSLIE